MKITKIEAKTISDSRGDPTLEVELVLDGIVVTSSIPSGKSKGKGEVFVLDPNQAILKLNDIKDQLLANQFESLEQFDQFLIDLDGTEDKHNLGGNLILALSISFTKAWAKLQNLQIFQLISQITNQKRAGIPLCFFNLIEGGVHTKAGLPFQEYLFVPKTNSAEKSLSMAQEMVKALAITQKDTGDEGGFSINSSDPREGIIILNKAQEKLGFDDSFISLDVAASTFYQDGGYSFSGSMHNRSEMINLYSNFVSSFPILSIEDPFAQEDFEGFGEITKLLGGKVWIVGDDLTTTNSISIKKAHEGKLINAVIIKPNQIGTVTETLKSFLLAKEYGMKVIVSHRSGETMDSFIADLAAGINADAIKSGAPTQKERLVKYQRLIEIEKFTSAN